MINPVQVLYTVTGTVYLVAELRKFYDVESERRRARRAGEPDPVRARGSVAVLEHVRRWTMVVAVAGALPLLATFPFKEIEIVGVVMILGIMIYVAVSFPATLVYIALGPVVWVKRRRASAAGGQRPATGDQPI